MITFLTIILSAVILLSMVYAAFAKNPYDKIIVLGMIFGAILPFIIIRGYLDAAIALSVLVPATTVILLQAVWRCRK